MARWDGEVALTTPRLTLRTFLRDDLAHYAALNADPVVVEFLGGQPLTRQYSDEIAEWANERWAQERIGLLAVERRSDARFLGMCGIHHLESFPDDLEVGWRLAHEHWGHGYATEAATAWLDYAFEVLGSPRVISTTDEPNVRSIAVMQRLGLSFDRLAEVTDDGITFQAVLYSITAQEWRRRRRASGTPA
jgi:RimJ/RimL family protein N-acetyltransferase